MTPLQIEITRLIGKKELTFGCLFYDDKSKDESSINRVWNGDLDSRKQTYSYWWWEEWETVSIVEIIGHPATLSDFHRWMNEKELCWRQEELQFTLIIDGEIKYTIIQYKSYKDLLDQDESVLKQIISLIKENK